jgi:hypothetical protein
MLHVPADPVHSTAAYGNTNGREGFRTNEAKRSTRGQRRRGEVVFDDGYVARRIQWRPLNER